MQCDTPCCTVYTAVQYNFGIATYWFFEILYHLKSNECPEFVFENSKMHLKKFFCTLHEKNLLFTMKTMKHLFTIDTCPMYNMLLVLVFLLDSGWLCVEPAATAKHFSLTHWPVQLFALASWNLFSQQRVTTLIPTWSIHTHLKCMILIECPSQKAAVKMHCVNMLTWQTTVSCCLIPDSLLKFLTIKELSCYLRANCDI